MGNRGEDLYPKQKMGLCGPFYFNENYLYLRAVSAFSLAAR
jgi:hypothetical protein